MKDEVKTYRPTSSKKDPCTPISEKTYVLPPQLFTNYQPTDLPQFTPKEALQKGTLWPDLFSQYKPKK